MNVQCEIMLKATRTRNTGAIPVF